MKKIIEKYKKMQNLRKSKKIEENQRKKAETQAKPGIIELYKEK